MNERDCENCKYHVYDDVMDFWMCEKWECEFEPKEKADDIR